MKPSREEDEAEHRARTTAAFKELCPGVLGNPFIPHLPHAPQAMFLGLHQMYGTDDVLEALYGGAAGGGKSDALLMAAAQFVDRSEFSAIMFRRTFKDLTQPEALLDRAMEWWLPAGAQWQGSKGIFLFPSGAKVAMSYLKAPQDHLKYQGAAYHLSAWDELTQWPDSAAYEYVGKSRLRRLAGSTIPLRTLSASNPGGPGHDWVKHRFVGGVNPDTGEAEEPDHIFVPARLSDNPSLDQIAYEKTLWGLHPTVRDQLLNGDWGARDQGDYFQSAWFGPLLDYANIWSSSICVRVRWWDLAASVKKDASKTAGVRMARHVSGARAVEHCRAGRWTPGERDDVIIQTAMSDGPTVVVGIEIEPGSGGLAQFLSLEKRLKERGFRVAGDRPRVNQSDRSSDLIVRQTTALSGKTGRADPVAACLYRGYLRRGEAPHTLENERSPYFGIDVSRPDRDGIRLYAGPWNHNYLSAIEGFPPKAGKAGVDEVDATSGAWAWLEANPSGMGVPVSLEQIEDRSKAYNHDYVEEDEDEDEVTEGQDKRGLWLP